jgi:hypothetical protein
LEALIYVHFVQRQQKRVVCCTFFLFFDVNLTHALVLFDPTQVEAGQGTGTQYVNLSTLTSRMGLASEDNMEERVDEVRIAMANHR